MRLRSLRWLALLGLAVLPGLALADPPNCGCLSLMTIPWTRVSDGDRSLGDTPIVCAHLAPGVHTLRLVNEAKGIDTTRSIEIRTGEKKVLKFVLK